MERLAPQTRMMHSALSTRSVHGLGSKGRECLILLMERVLRQVRAEKERYCQEKMLSARLGSLYDELERETSSCHNLRHGESEKSLVVDYEGGVSVHEVAMDATFCGHFVVDFGTRSKCSHWSVMAITATVAGPMCFSD